ncbi:polysaccharide deacetylase family protein [Streptomyces sp. NPDC002643]
MTPRTLTSTASALLLAGALTLTTACSLDPTVPRSAPALGGPPAKAAAGTTIDPATIEGLDIVNDSGNGRFCPWATSYPDVPGAPALTAAMEKDVDKRLADFLGAATDDTTRATNCDDSDRSGAPATRELNIGFAVLVASGDVVGVRLSSRDQKGPSAKTYWYDGAGKAYRAAPELIERRHRAALVSALPRRLPLDDIAFTPDGGLRVAGDVILDKAKVTPWLSEFGRRARSEAVDPSPALDLAATGSPTPTVPALDAPGKDTTDCSRVKCVALTFDDGPAVPESTELLDHLAEYGARATFFVVGQNAAVHRAVVRAQSRAGHEIGNHSWNHQRLTRLTTEEARSQLVRTSDEIRAATGAEPTLFRPPYGSINERVRNAARPLPSVLWDVDSRDWEDRDADRVAQRVIAETDPGEIILLHDIHPTTVAAVPQILHTLEAGGYHFVTVGHLRATPNLRR